MSKMQAIQERVRKIIERARREQSNVLDLSRYSLPGKLEEIPDAVFDEPQLETLILLDNNIREVPERIREMASLKRLYIARNPIEKLPDIPGLVLDWAGYLRCRKTLSSQNVEGIWVDITNTLLSRVKRIREPQLRRELALLPNLRSLYIGLPSMLDRTKVFKPTEEIRDLIAHIGQFTLLESLGFSGLLLEEVPDGIRHLKNLNSLSIGGAELDEIPDWLGGLRRLRYLWLEANDLIDLPPSLATLPEIEVINLNKNQFAEIPKAVFRMKSLSHLSIGCTESHIHECHITQIPADILKLTKLKTLYVEGQPIEVPPPEVVNQGVEAIKNYWRQQQEVGIDYLCEAKLIIVGEAGAGKTTLARKIEDPNYKLQLQEPATEGIDVVRWSFPSAVRVKRDGKDNFHHTDFNVSIWDFGGQEIYHATHQFFLTRRSLYALVADDRKEDTDFNYWLQVVELLSDRSPLLIVQNEKQDRKRDIDLGSLRARFPNLREAFRTNLATNRGLSEIERMIRQELERLPHIGTPLPKTWSQVRTALENDPRNYISLDEYFTVCQNNGFTRRDDKLQLSGYLHDLGICLHFQDDPVLKNTVILKPKWGTDAVYSLLNDRTVLEQRGRFGPNDLARIWSDEKYSSMRDELLQLMVRFQLCYRLPSAEAYIAPQLLSATRPPYEWNARDSLVLRYEYDFMPKGIVTRFIVAVNHLIADQNLVWKSGVNLARDGARAEIIEDYARRKITVRVSGANSRGLLAIADDQLDRIHASFNRLKYDKFLPCNCDVCRTRDEPFAYPLSELKDFAEQGDRIQCRISRKLVDAAYLIRDVLPSAAYSAEMLRSQPDFVSQEICPPVETSPLKEVFVSYAWTKESEAVVDKLQEAFNERGILLIRDKSEMRYKDSIRNFIDRIGRGKCIVVVLSKKYLESKTCMFEMAEIAERGSIRDRVFPILFEDANIYDAIDRLGYIQYWEEKKEELNVRMKKVSGENLQGIREELDLFARIRNTMAEIVNILGDMNALTAGQHQESNFQSLIEALDDRLAK